MDWAYFLGKLLYISGGISARCLVDHARYVPWNQFLKRDIFRLILHLSKYAFLFDVRQYSASIAEHTLVAFLRRCTVMLMKAFVVPVTKPRHSSFDKRQLAAESGFLIDISAQLSHKGDNVFQKRAF